MSFIEEYIRIALLLRSSTGDMVRNVTKTSPVEVKRSSARRLISCTSKLFIRDTELREFAEAHENSANVSAVVTYQLGKPPTLSRDQKSWCSVLFSENAYQPTQRHCHAVRFVGTAYVHISVKRVKVIHRLGRGRSFSPTPHSLGLPDLSCTSSWIATAVLRHHSVQIVILYHLLPIDECRELGCNVSTRLHRPWSAATNVIFNSQFFNDCWFSILCSN